DPFFGGGYHPPSPRYGMPSFIQFLHHAIRLIDKNNNIGPVLQRQNTPPTNRFSWCYSWDTRIDTGYADAFDFMNHGFGIAPKYLNIARLKSWYSFSNRKKTVTDTVKKIITSPILDPINGCVYRKCEDALWELPVREALLDEQAEFISLMMHILPKTPCISFLLTHIQNQYSLENGLFLQSISYHPPDISSLNFMNWKEGNPHFSTLPTVKDCTKLLKTTIPNIAYQDHRAVCSSNAKLLKTLIEYQIQQPTEAIEHHIIKLEQSIWNHFGWKEKKDWYHTAQQKLKATGLDLALVIQSMLALQDWKPKQNRQKELLALVNYWEENYVQDHICYTHPQQRFFHRGVDLIADNCASTQEEAGYTLILLQQAGIPTKNQARSFIQNQQWLVYKNPKIISTALFTWKQITPPIHNENTYEKTILAFDVHRPLSHQFLEYIQQTDVFIWAQCEISQQYLTQYGHHKIILKHVSWDICNKKGHLHTGLLHPQDMERFLGFPPSDVKEKLICAFSHKTETYIHSTYTIKSTDGTILLTFPYPIICFCFYEDTYWWITKGRLYSSKSDTPHVLPSPLTTPVSICVHHGALLIAQREDLWLFHISQEQFGRYAGRSGPQQKDGLVHTAVFQNITSICTYANYILISDADKLRIIETQTHMVHTLGDHPPFSYASSIIMHNKNIYIADYIQQCIWLYSIECEYTKRWNCHSPKSIHVHNQTLWVLSQDHLIEIKQEYF
ncbi:MAG: hypothetical protein CL916_08640, partial [Deltaproteobacteria bacterium]|nr:hypothetical protein [Deltaproteobacteria bacterium]